MICPKAEMAQLYRNRTWDNGTRRKERVVVLHGRCSRPWFGMGSLVYVLRSKPGSFRICNEDALHATTTSIGRDSEYQEGGRGNRVVSKVCVRASMM